MYIFMLILYRAAGWLVLAR